MDPPSTPRDVPALWRRLAALLYDGLLLVALAAIVTFAFLPLSGGEALLVGRQGALARAYHAALLLAAFAYFGFSWTRGGQTLGMKAWRFRLRTPGGGTPGWVQAAERFAVGLALLLLAAIGAWELRAPATPLRAGAGVLLILPLLANFAWVAVDGRGRSLQDRVGGLGVERLP